MAVAEDSDRNSLLLQGSSCYFTAAPALVGRVQEHRWWQLKHISVYLIVLVKEM